MAAPTRGISASIPAIVGSSEATYCAFKQRAAIELASRIFGSRLRVLP
jgi:hypothetical protein